MAGHLWKLTARLGREERKMSKKHTAFAACVALLLVLVQTPDSFGRKLPAGFADQTHKYFAHGFDELCASAPGDPVVDKPRIILMILPFLNILGGNSVNSLWVIIKAPQRVKSRQSAAGKNNTAIIHGVKKLEPGTYYQQRPRRDR